MAHASWILLEVLFMVNRNATAARFSFGAIVALTMLAAGCSHSSGSSTGPSGTLVTIQIAGNRGNQSYSPNPMMMKVGQMVNWKNNDSITHTATADDGSFNVNPISAMSAQGAPVTMRTAGTFNYHCAIHAGMVGQIIVQP
jgi:plastocyanin